MIRLGFPASLDGEQLRVSEEIELIPLPDSVDHDVELDVWVPDPYPTRALRIWPHLRGVQLVLCLMAGTEWLPSDVGPHVTICNARGAHNISTAEWVVSAILAMLKHFPLFVELQHAAEWRRRQEATAEYERQAGDRRHLHPAVMVEELTDKRVLLVGYGAIAQEVERMLKPFRVNLARVARRPRTDPLVHPVNKLDDLLDNGEVVILMLPLNEQSRGLIGPAQLARMPLGALLVNAARGPIVQTAALVQALQSGKIRAALDVTDPEPLPANHPLWRCPNLLLTPHVAASSPQFAPRAMAIVAAELERWLRQEPLQNAVQVGH